MEKQRLQKFIADAGLMSRRAAEAEILSEVAQMEKEFELEIAQMKESWIQTQNNRHEK